VPQQFEFKASATAVLSRLDSRLIVGSVVQAPVAVNPLGAIHLVQGKPVLHRRTRFLFLEG